MGKYPILGIGAGSFHSIASFYPGVQYTEEGLPTHNTYLSVFSELGAIGFILYTAALAAIIAIARRTESGFRIAYLSSITAFLIGSSSLTYEMRSQQWLLFVLILVHCHAINSNQTLTIRRNAILAKKANNLIEAPIT